MSNPVERLEIITGRERRRLYCAEEKVRLMEETRRPGMTVSAIARLAEVAVWTAPALIAFLGTFFGSIAA